MDLALPGGAPDVTGLPSDEIMHGSVLHMRRHFITNDKRMSIRFHHLLRSDDDRDLHDHPWDFASLLLTGSYVEVTPDGATEYEAPHLIVKRADELHRIELPDGPVWTYVVTGPVIRRWGFATGGGWVPWTQYEGI